MNEMTRSEHQTPAASPPSDGKISTWLQADEVRNRLARTLGESFDAGMFVEQILIALSADELSGCSLRSKFEAAHKCAALGMLPTLKHVALIPYNVKDPNTGRVVRTDCTVMPQWQGLQALMMRHPDVMDITHSLVHPDDIFEFDGTSQTVIVHQYDPFDASRTFRAFKDIRGGYIRVIFHNPNRPHKFHMVSRDKIAQARNCARSNKFWGPFFEEQCIKTLYRNAYARRAVPIDPTVTQMQFEEALKQEDTINLNQIPAHQPVVPRIRQGEIRPLEEPPEFDAEPPDGEPDQVEEVLPTDPDDPTDTVYGKLLQQVQSINSAEDATAATHNIGHAKSQGWITEDERKSLALRVSEIMQS